MREMGSFFKLFLKKLSKASNNCEVLNVNIECKSESIAECELELQKATSVDTAMEA